MSITTNLTNKKDPSVNASLLKDEIFDEAYELSVVYIDDEYSKKLNSEYRKKANPTNVLSFEISDKTGEIFINLDIVKREHDDFSMTYEGYIGFLLIHGMLHLNGYSHGSTMEELERGYIDKFNFK